MNRSFVRVFAGLVSLLLTLSVVAKTEVSGVRAVAKADSTRLVLELNQTPTFRKFHLTSPNRLVLDLQDTSTQLPSSLFNLDDQRINNVRAARRGNGVRLVFDLADDFPSKAFTLEGPARLVVDLLGAQAVTAQPTASADVAPAAPVVTPSGPPRDIIVAIDPGHGGKDPGALGRGGVREKDVVLKISQRLKS